MVRVWGISGEKLESEKAQKIPLGTRRRAKKEKKPRPLL